MREGSSVVSITIAFAFLDFSTLLFLQKRRIRQERLDRHGTCSKNFRLDEGTSALTSKFTISLMP